MSKEKWWKQRMTVVVRELRGWSDTEVGALRKLLDDDVVNWREARRYAISEEFLDLYKKPGKDGNYRTARDIELELSVRYELSLDTVRFLRLPRRK